MTLTKFLLERITEDEETANATCGKRWRTLPDREVGYFDVVVNENDEFIVGLWSGESVPDGDDWVPVPTSGTGSVVEDAAHIARHDPVRVLAECAAKRRIIALHEVQVDEDGGSTKDGRHDTLYWCATCDEDRGYGCWIQPGCQTLRILAAVYADHPDYRDEWMPLDARPT